MQRELECEIWCRPCGTSYAQVFRVMTRDGVWENVKEPATAPSVCTLCGSLLERRRS